jgi:CubicO group peptidase (beta-lactamase class C family)
MEKFKTLSRFLILLFVTIAIALLAIGPVWAEEQDPYQSAIITARTEAWRSINSGISGSATVAIMDQGQLVYAEGFGMADRAKSIPVDAETIFNIGSISKLFCATAVMLLVDDGLVKLDNPVIEYLPEFTMADDRYRDITVRMLLNHSSGFPGSCYANMIGYQAKPDVFRDTLDNLSRATLKHAPGEMAPYCNDGFTLAEMLVERVSGQSYIDFLSERVFQPLSQKRTGKSLGERPKDLLALFYAPDTGQEIPLEVLSGLGAGGLASTAIDLVRFADTFSGKGNQILSSEAIAEMTSWQPSLLAQKAWEETGLYIEFACGLGLDLAIQYPQSGKGVKLIGKGGDTTDYHSMLLSAPEERLSVAVIQSGRSGDAVKIAFAIMDSLLVQKGLMEIPAATVAKPKEPQAIPEEYLAFQGYYAPNPFKVIFDLETNTVNVTKLDKKEEVPVATLTYRDGHFYSPDDSRFSFLTVNGHHLLMVSIFNQVVEMPIGQQLSKLDEPLNLGIDVDGKRWLRRNVLPGEAFNPEHIMTSQLIEDLPGYVVFQGIKQILSPQYAGIPVGAVRDQTDLTLFENNGHTWARVFDFLYSPIETAPPLETGENEVTIGSFHYSEWLSATEECIVDIQKPEKGRVFIFSPEGSVLYDSLRDSGSAYVPAGGFIELIGHAGDVFNVTRN